MILREQITFRNMDASEAAVARIQEETSKLDRYFDRITSSRVMVECPHRHHRSSKPFHFRIELGVPGKELVITHEPTSHTAVAGEEETHVRKHEDVLPIYVAIRDGFAAMRRQLQDYVRRLRERLNGAFLHRCPRKLIDTDLTCKNIKSERRD